MRRTLGLSWAASCYYVCLRASSSCTDRSVRGFPDPDIAIPSLAYSHYISTSAVLPIVHFIHLSYCCLDRPCHYVGYQHLISPAWSEPHDVVANAHYPSTSYFNLRSIATIPNLILLIHRPITVLDPYLRPPSTQLVAYSRFVSRRFSFITDCQPSTLCHDLGSYTPPNHTNNPPRPRHTRLPLLCDRHIEQSNALKLSAFCLLQSSALHTILMPGFVLLAFCES